MVWKVVTNADAGDADHFGGNDVDKISQAFSGTDVDDFDMACDFKFRDGKLQLSNPANTFKYTINTSAISADRILTVPLITGTDTLATLGLANTFTNTQTIFLTGADFVKLYRDSSTATNGIQLFFDAKDSASNQTTYSKLRGEISDSTNGNEDGFLSIYTMNNGTLADNLRVNADGRLDCGGPNRRIALQETGLTATRTYTFPDTTTEITGLSGVQTNIGAKTFLDQTLKLRNPANTFSYTLVHGAIAADRNLNVPVITATDTLATLGLAQTFTADTTLGAGLISQGFVRYEGDISPTQITSDQNDYNPTGLSTATRIRLDADTSFRTITGLAGGADGRMIKLSNISANTILLANQNTGSSSGNRFDFGGFDIPLFTGASVELIYDSTSTKWRLLDSGSLFVIPSARQGVYAMVHYLADTSVESGLFTETAASGGTATAQTPVVPHHGVLGLTFGTSGTGSAASKINNSSIIFGNSWYWKYEAVVKIEALSSADPDYTLRIGFIDSGTAESTDGAFFRYNDGVNSGKFQKVTRNNNTETGSANDTTVTADTNWHRYTIIVNPAGNVAEFFVDGVSKGTETTNIPTGAGRATGAGVMFLKTAGTTDALGIQIDSQEIVAYANVTN